MHPCLGLITVVFIGCIGISYYLIRQKRNNPFVPNVNEDKISQHDHVSVEYMYKDFASTLNCTFSKSFEYPTPSFEEKAKSFFSEESIIERTKDCQKYFEIINSGGFVPVTKEEEELPLAFSAMVHKEIGIFEMFLSLYFRPKDMYCIHVDSKASLQVFSAVQGIVRCYNEIFPSSLVFTPRHTIPVFWATGGSMLQADWICYRELLERRKDWKYVVNVAGTELPFVSIQRFRQKVKENGGSLINLQIHKRSLMRQKKTWTMFRTGPKGGDLAMKGQNLKSNPAPCNLKVFKGPKSSALSSEFVHFGTSNDFALDLFNWIATISVAEEHFQSTLASLTIRPSEAGPGKWRIWQRFDQGIKHFKGTMLTNNSWLREESVCYKEYLYNAKNSKCHLVQEKCSEKTSPMRKINGWTFGLCVRAALWSYGKCAGKNIRSVCNLGLEDLPVIKKKNCLIGNKFGIDIDIAAIWCQYKEIYEWTKNYDPNQTQNGL